MNTLFSGCKYVVRHTLSIVGVLAVVGILITLGVIYSGHFNVAATVADSAPLRWLFVTVREASIIRHARGIEAPQSVGPQQLENGFRFFRSECAMCHTPIGQKAKPMAAGLNPQPPSFQENDMTAAELFWATKNGIRFTAMPGWGPSRSDQDIWDVVAFIMTLPKMSAADYEAMDRRIPPVPAP